MSNYRTRNQLFAAKIETTSGTEAAPAVADDAILVERGVAWSPNFDVLQTNEVTATLDGAGPLVGGGFGALTVPLYVKGSGAQGTPPEFGPLLRAAGMAEVVTASAVTGTAQAGSTTSITLAAGASSTTNLYRGMVIRATAGAGSGQRATILAYNGSTKVATLAETQAVAFDNTTQYSIDANVLYRPASAGLETLTAHLWQRSNASGSVHRLRKLIGAAASFRLDIPIRNFPTLTFALRGIIPAAPADVADPTGAVFDATRPRPFIGASARLAGVAFKLATAAIDYGATVDQPDDPAATFGYAHAGLTERRITGSINPILEAIATRDLFADFLAGTQRALAFRWGATDGNRVSILVPAAQPTAAQPSDTRGYASEDVPFESVGQDSGLFISFH